MKVTTIAVLSIVSVFGLNYAASAAPIPAFSFDNASYSAPGDFSLGNEFTPTTQIYVTHVGYYDRDADGLGSNSEVGIYRTSDMGLVAGTYAVVAAGTSELLLGNATNGYFRYHELATPVMLSAGTTYRVTGNTGGANGYTYTNYSNLAADPAITLGIGYYASGTSLTYTGTTSPFSAVYGGANFLFVDSLPVPAPEPTSLVLLGFGSLLLVRRQRRRVA